MEPAQLKERNVFPKYFLPGILIVDILILNILTAFLYLKKDSKLPIPETTPQTDLQSNCLDDCKNYIDEKIAGISFPTSSPKGIVKTIPKPTAKTKSVSYFSVPGTGSTLQNSWTDISGTDFFFDPAEHPGLSDVRFETNIRLVNGNGQASIRLYDVTHSIGVNNSDVYTTSQTSSLVTSGAINFWSGRNQYRVQIKSLTADTAVYESGRLRMVIEN